MLRVLYIAARSHAVDIPGRETDASALPRSGGAQLSSHTVDQVLLITITGLMGCVLAVSLQVPCSRHQTPSCVGIEDPASLVPTFIRACYRTWEVRHLNALLADELSTRGDRILSNGLPVL
jgi:hypothetical protein